MAYSGRFAVHSAPRIGGDAVAVHLFNVEDATKLVTEFAHLPLAGSEATQAGRGLSTL